MTDQEEAGHRARHGEGLREEMVVVRRQEQSVEGEKSVLKYLDSLMSSSTNGVCANQASCNGLNTKYQVPGAVCVAVADR